jgi:hypothetical protein
MQTVPYGSIKNRQGSRISLEDISYNGKPAINVSCQDGKTKQQIHTILDLGTIHQLIVFCEEIIPQKLSIPTMDEGTLGIWRKDTGITVITLSNNNGEATIHCDGQQMTEFFTILVDIHVCK